MASSRAFWRLPSTCRSIPSSVRRYAAPSFGQGPAPPRLPEEEQKLYEKLQQGSTGAFSTPKPSVVINQSAASSKNTDEASSSGRPQVNQVPRSASETAAVDARVQANGKGEELHPNIRRGAQPEFEGERNPLTGEVGGPKNDPLRWKGDWSYNGRVSDF